MRTIENYNRHKSDITSNARWLRRHPGKDITSRRGQSATCPLDSKCGRATLRVRYINPLMTHIKKP